MDLPLRMEGEQAKSSFRLPFFLLAAARVVATWRVSLLASDNPTKEIPPRPAQQSVF